MDPVLKRICDEHGVFLRKEAEDLGYNDAILAKLIKAGVFHRVRHGAYTFGDIWADLTDNERYGLLCRAVYRQSKTDVVLSHLSSANEWDCPLWDADMGEVHLTRTDCKTGRREAGVRQHRGELLEGDVEERNGLQVVCATRTALELTTLTDIEHALVEIDDLLHRKLTTPEKLVSRYELMSHWPNTLGTGLVLRLMDGRSESVGETRIRYLCWVQRLPTPIPNYPIRDRHGRVIHRVDLAWPELGLFLEFDGKVKYQRFLREGESVTDVVLREKKREELICELTGWRCIRIIWADLYRPEQTAARIRAMFRPVGTAA
jgi:hypothetical protein